jgi:hypothetical protein
MTGNPAGAAATIGAGVAGGVIGAEGEQEKRKPLPFVGDPTYVKEAMEAPYTQGSYADLSPSMRFQYADTPYMGIQAGLGGTQAQDLAGLWQRAQGRNLLATQQGLQQQQALQSAALAQAASARGRYNPALAAVAQRQAGALPGQMAAGIQAAEQQERLNALQAYTQGSQQFQQQGQAATQAWLARQAMERQRQLEEEQARRAALGLEQQSRLDAIANRAAVESIRTGIGGLGSNYRTAVGEVSPYFEEPEG